MAFHLILLLHLEVIRHGYAVIYSKGKVMLLWIRGALIMIGILDGKPVINWKYITRKAGLNVNSTSGLQLKRNANKPWKHLESAACLVVF